jgi:hypothetical protein
LPAEGIYEEKIYSKDRHPGTGSDRDPEHFFYQSKSPDPALFGTKLLEHPECERECA